MKKHILLFFVGILCNIGAMAQVINWTPVKTTQMNPFAYNLSATLNANQSELTIKYSLNADVKSLKIVITDGAATVTHDITDENKLKKTTAEDPYLNASAPHIVTIPTQNLPKNTELTWRIEVKGEGRANCGVYSLDGTNVYRHKFYRPSSVDIVQDPTSFNYGKVLVVESQHLSSSESGYHSSSKVKTKGVAVGNTDPQGAGIYVFNPDLTPRENKSGTYVFNGNNDSRFANTSFSPHRVRVSDDGRMFVTSMDHTKGAILWEIDNYFSTWTTVMGAGVGGAKYNTSTYDLTTSGGSFIAGPNAGFDVRGSGSELTLLMLSCDKNAFANDHTGFECREYNLGTAPTWSSVPNKDFKTNDHIFVSERTSNVQYDEKGGIWCVSYRDACTQNQPGLVHKNAAGTEDCRIMRDKTKNAALRFNNTFTRAMMAGEGNYGTLYDYMPNHGSNNATQGYFFNHTNIDMSAVGTYLNDFAWDNANNIYAVGQSSAQNGGNGYVVVYCLPYSENDVFTTPGPKKITLTETICWHPYPEGHQVTNEDLWEAFQRDYNDWYRFHENAENKISEAQAHQPITNAYGFTFPSDKIDENTYKYRDGLVSDLLTDEKSKWKWLGDYIKIAANPTIIPADNAALWGSSNTDVNGFMYYFNQYYGVNRATQTINNVASFWDSNGNYCNKTQGNILQAEGSAYKWLGDYIKSVAESQGNSINTESAWRWHLYAFFNCTDGTKQATGQLAAASNFTEAGKPENWQPYYVSPEGKNQIDTEMEWRKEVHAFFNKANTCTYVNANKETVTENTGDYTTAGKSDQANDGANGWWNEWWDATFKPTMEAYPTDSLPTIRRKGYVLSGWYYGDNDGYSLDDRENTKGQTRGGCLWARWLETCLYEGYITGTIDNSAAIEEMGQQINRNIELMNIIQGKSDYPMDIERKLQGGVYNTFALPFALSKQVNALNYIGKIVDVNNENTQLLTGNTSILRYQGSSIIENGEGEYILQLNFAEWEGTDANDYIAASTPILIKPENNITQRMHTKWNPYISTAYHPVSDSYVEFIPILAPAEVQGGAGSNNLILVADNRLAKLTSSGTILGLRAYFNGSEIPSDLSPKQMIIKITEKNGVVTYLDNIETPQQGASAIKIMQNGQIYILRDGKVYDMMGHQL